MTKGIKITLFAFLCGLVLFLTLFGGLVFKFGGFAPLAAYLNGEAVYIYPKIVDLKNQEPATETVAVFKMKNLTSKEISVIGEKSSCSCAFSEQIPVFAAPGKTADIKIRVHLPTYDSSYDQTVILMVAEPNRLAMHPVRVRAAISKPLPRPVEKE